MSTVFFVLASLYLALQIFERCTTLAAPAIFRHVLTIWRRGEDRLSAYTDRSLKDHCLLRNELYRLLKVHQLAKDEEVARIQAVLWGK